MIKAQLKNNWANRMGLTRGIDDILWDEDKLARSAHSWKHRHTEQCELTAALFCLSTRSVSRDGASTKRHLLTKAAEKCDDQTDNHRKSCIGGWCAKTFHEPSVPSCLCETHYICQDFHTAKTRSKATVLWTVTVILWSYVNKSKLWSEIHNTCIKQIIWERR